MKRFFTLLLACVCLLAGCKQEEHEKETVQWDAKPSIVVDGVLYGTTGRSGVYETTEIPENGGRVDGEITSSVESYEYPTEDD